MIFKATLEDIGHPQPKIPVHCDNATAFSITNNTIKCQRSCAMEMKYFWTCEKDAQKVFSSKWHPGMENLADYQSKHHPGGHHMAISLYNLFNLHEKNSSLELPHAIRQSTLKGCVGTLKDGYICNVPLPRVQRIQSASDYTKTNQSQVDMYKYASGKGTPLPDFLPVSSWIPTLPKLGRLPGFSQRIL